MNHKQRFRGLEVGLFVPQLLINFVSVTRMIIFELNNSK